MTEKELQKILDEKYESYLLIGQEEEFEETDLHLHAYSMGIMSLMEGAFAKYPPLKEIIIGMLNRESK